MSGQDPTAGTAGSPPPAALKSPASLWELAWVFNRLSLQGFGGVIAVAQRELVEHQGWLSREDFVDMLAVGQLLPGPNVLNLSLMVGDRYFGTRGALASLTGLLAVPLLIVLALAALYGQFMHLPVVSGALRGMGTVAAGLVMATAFKLMPTLKTNVMGWRLGGLLAALTFVLMVVWHTPLVLLLALLGPAGYGLAWHQLGKA